MLLTGAGIDSEELRQMMIRGISEKKARDLLSNVKPGQQVIDQLEWGDEVLRKARPGTFHNPPGLLISFIEGNLTPPTHFESSRMKSLREEALRENALHGMKRAELKVEYEDYRRGEAERYLEEELAGAEYKRIFAAKKQELATAYKSLLLNPASLTEMAHAGVRSEIMCRLQLQSFEKFCEQRLGSS